MDTTARHLFIIPPTPQATRPVQLRDRQRRKLHPGAVSTKHGMAMPDGRSPRARKSRNEISVACNAIMSVQYIILYYIVGPTCRGPNIHVRASLEIQKGGVRCARGRSRHTSSRELSQGKAVQHTVDVGYYALAARTTLIPLCLSCS